MRAAPELLAEDWLALDQLDEDIQQRVELAGLQPLHGQHVESGQRRGEEILEHRFARVSDPLDVVRSEQGQQRIETGVSARRPRRHLCRVSLGRRRQARGSRGSQGQQSCPRQEYRAVRRVRGPLTERLRHVFHRIDVQHGVRVAAIRGVQRLHHVLQVHRLYEYHRAHRPERVREPVHRLPGVFLPSFTVHPSVVHQLRGRRGRPSHRALLKRDGESREPTRRAPHTRAVVHVERAVEHHLRLLERLRRPHLGELGVASPVLRVLSRSRRGGPAHVRAERASQLLLQAPGQQVSKARARVSERGRDLVVVVVFGVRASLQKCLDAFHQLESLGEVVAGEADHEVVVAGGGQRRLVLIQAAPQERVGLHLVQRQPGRRLHRHLADRFVQVERLIAVAAHRPALHRSLGRRRRGLERVQASLQKIRAVAEQLLDLLGRSGERPQALEHGEDLPVARKDFTS